MRWCPRVLVLAHRGVKGAGGRGEDLRGGVYGKEFVGYQQQD